MQEFFHRIGHGEKKWKKLYDINIQTIKSALSEETNCFEKAADVLKETLFELTDSAGLPEMMEWIEGFTQFPSRKTGSKEARISAEYIKKTFEDMGLTETAVETAPSVSWICDDYHLRACGRDIECFPLTALTEEDIQADLSAMNRIKKSSISQMEIKVILRKSTFVEK